MRLLETNLKVKSSLTIRKIIFARLFSVHNIITLSRHEQVGCVSRDTSPFIEMVKKNISRNVA